MAEMSFVRLPVWSFVVGVLCVSAWVGSHCQEVDAAVPVTVSGKSTAGTDQERTSVGSLPLRMTITTGMSQPDLGVPGRILHVSPDGDNQATGLADAPFASLERARDEIRALRKQGDLPWGGVQVQVHGGVYTVTQTFELDDKDSGESGAVIRYSAAPGEKPVFRGGERLSGWKPLTDETLYPLIPKASRDKVLMLDLEEAGVTDLLPLKLGGFASGYGFRTHPANELFFNGQALQVARGPNEGFLRIADVVVKDGTKGYDREGSKSGIFKFKGDYPKRWAAEPDLLLYGYWFWDWADSYERVTAIDPDTRTVTLAKPWHRYGYSIGAPFYAYHALSELDQPGEWYLDSSAKRVLMIPPSDPSHAVIELSTFSSNMVSMESVSYVRFEGLTWELGSGDAVRIRNGEGCQLVGCTLRRFAGNAVDIQGGMRHGLLSCDIYGMGRGGIVISGGNRKTLTPGGHFIENCDIHDLSRIDHTYTPAIVMSGVGNQIRHNRLHNILSSAIRLGGNNHIVEYNDVYDVVKESDDQGGLDMWGNPTYRGNIIRYNYWHHIGNWQGVGEEPKCGQCAVRLDDAICGVRIYGNVIERCSVGKNGFGGVQIHGGKDNWVENNLFVDCKIMVSCTPWGTQRWTDTVKAALDNPAVDRELYLKTYPDLANLLKDANLNHIHNNRALHCDVLYRRAPKNLDTNNNIQLPGGELTFEADNPLFNEAGFKPIPVEEIGAYRDEWRKH